MKSQGAFLQRTPAEIAYLLRWLTHRREETDRLNSSSSDSFS